MNLIIIALSCLFAVNTYADENLGLFYERTDNQEGLEDMGDAQVAESIQNNS